MFMKRKIIFPSILEKFFLEFKFLKIAKSSKKRDF